MALTISLLGDLRHDQTAGVQSGGTPDKDDIALTTDLTALPDPFEMFLESLSLTSTQLSNAATYGAATESGMVSVTGTGATDLYLSQSSGELFNGQVATYTDGTGTHNLTTAGSSAPIYLYSFAGGDILIGSTEAPTGVNDANGMPVAANLDGSQVVFAYYLAENMTHTGADLWGVTFKPMEHFVDGSTSAALDDTIDLGDFLNVSVSGSVSFDFDNLDSGNFLWAALGTESAGLLITGRDLNVQEGGRKDGQIVTGTQEGSDTVNTSQGGTGATTGINNQMFTPGSVAVLTFVTGFVPLPTDTADDAHGDNIKEIDYSGYTNVTTAGVFVSQTQGGTTASMTIGLYEAGDDGDPTTALQPEESFGYIGTEGGNDNTSGAFTDDTKVGIQQVQVYSGTTLIGTWVDGEASDGSTINGVMVTINAQEDAVIAGLSAGMEVFVTAEDGETFNRLQVSANAGSTPFDIGRVDLTEAVGDTANLGDRVYIHDDAPSVTVNNSSGTFATGAQGSWTDLAGTDEFGKLDVTLNSYTIGSGSAVSVDAALTKTGDYAFSGSITADFTPSDGVINNQTINFTLTFDPAADTYDFDLTTPPTTVTFFDTSQGQLRAGGPDPVQTLLFGGSEAGTDDVVFFGALANAPTSGVTGGNALANPPQTPNDLLDLIYSGPTDLTEDQIQSYLSPTNQISTLINSSTQMNVSTSGIGINNNNLDGSGDGIQASDESFVFNPEQTVDAVRVYIDNSVGGYTPATGEELYYTVYYTDGTVGSQTLVTNSMLANAARGDSTVPKAAQGGKYFEIDDNKDIDAVQLTMGDGTVKIPVIQWIIEEEFNPDDLLLSLTASLFDRDGDSNSDTFDVLLM